MPAISWALSTGRDARSTDANDHHEWTEVSGGEATGSAVEIEGTLAVAHVDLLPGVQGEEMIYWLESGTGSYRLRVPDDISGVEPGSRIRVSGHISGGVLLAHRHDADPVTVLSEPVQTFTGPNGEQKTVVLLVNFQDDTSQPITTATANGRVFTNADSLDKYYRENSYQAAWHTGTSYGWFTMSQTKTCDGNTLLSKAVAAADPTVNFAGQNRIILTFPGSCGWAGMGTVGARSVATADGTISASVSWIPSQYFSLGVLGHEMGHNYGVWHANRFDCGTAGFGGKGPSQCTNVEYGDPWDIMGNQGKGHLGAAHKRKIGWLSGVNVATQTSGAQTHTIQPLYTKGTGTMEVRVPYGSTGHYYSIEFRQSSGFDAGLSGSAYQGAQVRLHLGANIGTGDTEFIDMVPSTSAASDGVLKAGVSYADTINNINVKTLSVAASGTQVQVCFGACPSGNNPPGTPSTPSGPASGTTGTSYSYSSSSTDPDGNQVKIKFDWGDSTTTETALGASGSAMSASHTWSGAGTYPVKAMATDSNGATSAWSAALGVSITGSPNPTSFADDFNDGVIDGSKWTVSNAAEVSSCGSNSAPSALRLSGTGTRSATTRALDTSAATTLRFFAKTGTGSSTSGCENTDANENLAMEYSTNGGSTWTAIATYNEASYASFTQIDATLPAGAKAASTQFRWRQTAHSGSSYDNWAIDDVNLLSGAANSPPGAPSTPSGPASGTAGTSYSYSSSSTDPDGNQVKIKFDWGDSTTTETALGASGSAMSASHSWTSAGTFAVKAMATDSIGATSAWSAGLSVAISSANSAPGTPTTPSGTATGTAGTSYSYSSSSTDPDGNQVKIKFDWGDSTTTETALGASGSAMSASHSWASAGTFAVRAMATDSNGATSAWSGSLSVSISSGGGGVKFSDDIEGGAGSWAATGFWHIDTRRASSPTHSWWYGQVSTGNYANGARNSGTLTSSAISLSGASSATLTFRSFYSTEGGTSYDKKLVLVSKDNGATWTQVLQVSTGAGAWNDRTVNLNSFAGQTILLRFSFDTIDSYYNDYEGWFVDDVKVTT